MAALKLSPVVRLLTESRFCRRGVFALCVLAAFFTTADVAAQRASVRAWLDSVYVTIGTPTIIHLEANLPADATIAFPELNPRGVVAYDDTLSFYLEYGERPHVDTLSADGDRLILRSDLRVFAFDSATLVIPPFRFALPSGDTLSTNSLVLNVHVPFEVEVDPQKFFDIKDVIKPDLVLMDYIEWVIWPVIILVIVALVILLIMRYGLKTDTVMVPVPVEHRLPPHIEALTALDELETHKWWQNGAYKTYHTELTNILRNYIERRFDVGAMEKTTDEILDELYELAESQKSSLNSLHQILALADLVKFAKYQPLADENQLSMVNARMFVTQTKAEAVPSVADGAGQVAPPAREAL